MLLEVLVAFVIAALALGELFTVAASDLRAVHVAGSYEEALSRARSHLAATGPDGRLAAGEQTGDDGGGYHWAVRVTPAAVSPSPGEPRAALYAVSVAVSWHDGEQSRVVRLDTERVAPAPPPRP